MKRKEVVVIVVDDDLLRGTQDGFIAAIAVTAVVPWLWSGNKPSPAGQSQDKHSRRDSGIPSTSS